MKEKGLHFSNGKRTRDKINQCPEAFALYKATNFLFDKARDSKDLDPQEMAILDQEIKAELSKKLGFDLPRDVVFKTPGF